MKKPFLTAVVLLFSALVACSNPPPTPSVSSVEITTGETQVLSAGSTLVFASVDGANGASNLVNWTASAGSFSSPKGISSRFTAPTVTASTSVVITATSVQDPSKKATTPIFVLPPPPPASSVATVTPSAVSTNLAAAASTNLNAAVTGANGFSNAVNWSIVSGAGTLSSVSGATVAFTAPSLSSASVTIIRATSVQDANKSGTVVINNAALPTSAAITGLSANAVSSNLAAAASTNLSAVVTGTGAFSSNVLWSIVSGTGTLSAATGSPITFVAPSQNAASTTIIRASSAQDPSQSATVTVTVNPSPSSITSLALNASKVALREGEQSTLIANLTGTGAFNQAVTWTLENSVGSLNPAGNTAFYVAPIGDTQKIVRVTATSVQDSSVTKTIYMSVNPVRNTTIAAGDLHSLALKSDGTMLAWGWDSNGQLGDDATIADKSTPVAVSGATGIVSIAAGYRHSLALKSDGTMLAWGYDLTGQLGDDATIADKSTPVAVSGATGIVAISAGFYYSLALKSDGTMLAWGLDYYGQLGDDATLADKATPVAVSGASEIVAIVAGNSHSFALKSDGTMLAWGYDYSGQLGDDAAFVNKPIPVAVSGATGIVAIAASSNHSLALKSDGTMLAWGSDGNGQLGDDATLADKSTPVAVSGATGIVAIAAGGVHSLALKSDGTMLAWGSDGNGQLGDDAAFTDKPTPVSVLLGSSLIRLP